MASSGASPRRRAAAGPSVRSEPPPGAVPAARRRKGGGGGVRPASRPARLRRSPSPFLFPAEEKLVHCGSTKSRGPAPAGPACADRRLRGRGRGERRRGGRTQVERNLRRREQRGTTLGSRSERYRCPRPGLVAAAPVLALRRRRLPIVPWHPRAVRPRVPSPRRSGAGGTVPAGREPSAALQQAWAAGRGACGLGRAPRRAAILEAEPDCNSLSYSRDGRAQRAASSSRFAGWVARAALVEAFGQPQVSCCEPVLVLRMPSGPRAF